MRIVLALFIIITITACGTKKAATSVKEEVVGLASLGDVKQESDSYTIKSARIDGNNLILNVSFSGGCINYIPDLIGSEFIMKSLPPKRPIKFILKKEGECRELKEKEFVFDISSFAYKTEQGSEIILLLKEWDEPLVYVYYEKK